MMQAKEEAPQSLPSELTNVKPSLLPAGDMLHHATISAAPKVSYLNEIPSHIGGEACDESNASRPLDLTSIPR